jgi:hypothetical protein
MKIYLFNCDLSFNFYRLVKNIFRKKQFFFEYFEKFFRMSSDSRSANENLFLLSIIRFYRVVGNIFRKNDFFLNILEMAAS